MKGYSILEETNSFDRQVISLAENGRLLTSDGLLAGVADTPGVHYRKRDLLTQGGEWRGRQHPAIIDEGLNGVLVLGHSAKPFGFREAFYLRRKLPGISGIWAQNAKILSSKIKSFPVGLTNSFEYPVLGNQHHIAISIAEQSKWAEPAIYANFQTITSPRHRSSLDNRVKNSSSIVEGVYKPTDAGRVKYLKQMRKHGFVLCPRGKGEDTVRLFETLCVGAIPILLKREAPKWLTELESRPFVAVRRWSDIHGLDLDRLKLSTPAVDAQTLSTTYWLARISGNVAPKLSDGL